MNTTSIPGISGISSQGAIQTQKEFSKEINRADGGGEKTSAQQIADEVKGANLDITG
jgi:hypothetical protein